MGAPALELHEVSHRYGRGETEITALDRVSLRVEPGELVAVIGPSGSGKSTLLACAAGLEPVTRGEVSIGGTSISGLDDDALTELRRSSIGFVFQSYNLLPSLSAIDNIRLPFVIGGERAHDARIDALVDRLGIRDRLDHLPSALSGGQQQRTAIARALAMSPKIVFADEPTGALDTTAAAEVLDLLVEEASRGQAIVIVTHDATVAARADRVIHLRDGRVT